MRNKLVVLPLLAALAAAARPYSAAAGKGKAHGRALSVRTVYWLCSRDQAPVGASHGVVSVRAYYRGIPGAGPGQSGVLFDHEISSDSAWQLGLIPVPGTDKRMQTVKVARGALVVLGPNLLGGQTQDILRAPSPMGSG